MFVRHTLRAVRPSDNRLMHPIEVVLRKNRGRWLLVHISFPAHPGLNARSMQQAYLSHDFSCLCPSAADDFREPYMYELKAREQRAGAYPRELQKWLQESRDLHDNRNNIGTLG